MERYDPNVAPVPAQWLALDEQERMLLAEAYHEAARIELPNATVHAVVHVIVENQIAEGLESACRAMTRLMKEGLSRHEALHAIGSVVAEHLFEALTTNNPDDANTAQARYNAAVERLSAKTWRDEYGAD